MLYVSESSLKLCLDAIEMHGQMLLTEFELERECATQWEGHSTPALRRFSGTLSREDSESNDFIWPPITKALGNPYPQRTLGTFLAWATNCGFPSIFDCRFPLIQCRAVS